MSLVCLSVYIWSQWLPETVWLSTFFKISSFEERNLYRFGTTLGWVNDDSILIFGWTISLKKSQNAFQQNGGQAVRNTGCFWNRRMHPSKPAYRLPRHQAQAKDISTWRILSRQALFCILHLACFEGCIRCILPILQSLTIRYSHPNSQKIISFKSEKHPTGCVPIQGLHHSKPA